MRLATLLLAGTLSAQADALVQARRLIAAGSITEAISLLRRQPESADSYLLLGTALSLVPERTEALAAFEKAIALRPGSAAAYHTMGLALGRFAELEEASKAFQKAIALDPNFAAPHVNLALVLAQRKESAAALSHLDRAIRISPNAYAQLLKGRLLMELDRTADAAAALDVAVKLQPDNADTLLELGIAQRKLLNDQAALRSLQRGIEIAPEKVLGQAELGKLYLSLGHSQKAVEHLTVAHRLQPNDRSVLYSLSRALRAAGNSAEAEAIDKQLKTVLQAALNRDATMFEATALNNAGVELEKSGRYESALAKYRAAADLNPLNSGFRRNLALCLCRLRRWQEGIAELREVLRLNPDDAEATRALYLALDQPAVR